MEIIKLIERLDSKENSKLHKRYVQFGTLLKELKNKRLSNEIIDFINIEVKELNAIPTSEKRLKFKIIRKQSKIIRHIEKELKIVPKSYYRNAWLGIGMAVFGIPLGVAFGTSLDNIGLIGIGMPLGMVIGVVIGTKMDKKALKEGRQLDFEVKA